MHQVNSAIDYKQVSPGVQRKILSYSKKLMICELLFEKDAVGAIHSHPHEQIGYLVSGSLIFKEEGQEDVVLHAGDDYQVAPNVKHGIVALEPTKLIDIFTPYREDFVE